jgi:UDP-N-acetylglucosamine--N-acetylmuramyl-(pentapeptide) pyrophosphoryl-undecaprenol N-acetylglucosamine transferase
MTSHSMAVVIAAGGTGGHVYPGLAIAQEFRRQLPNARIVFVGTARGLESRVMPQAGFELELIEVKALKRVSAASRAKSLLLLPRSFLEVAAILRRVRPAVVIGVGGYTSGPVVLMAWMLGFPTLVAEQNAMPGFTNRVLARFVRAAAVTFDETRRYFGSRAEITGNPVRADFFNVQPPEPHERVHVLVTGGSQGAHAINEAVMGALPALSVEHERVSFTHQTGEADYARVLDAFNRSGITAEVGPFIENMVDEMAKADLVVSRAGATTLAELAAAGRPAIMIPLPYAADDHQRKNAEAFEKAGAGRMVLQSALTPERLAKEILALARDPERLRSMAAASRGLAHRDAAAKVVELARRISK